MNGFITGIIIFNRHNYVQVQNDYYIDYNTTKSQGFCPKQRKKLTADLRADYQQTLMRGNTASSA